MTSPTCMNCRGSSVETFIDLGRQPNGNLFLPESELANEPTFPLEMAVCTDCWQVQIAEFPSQEFLFSDHPYLTGVNKPVVEHFNALAPHIAAKLGLGPGDLVLDIGCNDGTFLDAFRTADIDTLGIDPGERVVGRARDKGHEVIRGFFNEQSARKIRDAGHAPKLITAAAVFYHVPDLHDFISGLDVLMDDRTVFVAQCVSMRDLMEKLEFDHFYHEHSCIHSVGALHRLFAQHGMRLLDVEHYDIHGGSFVAYVVRDGFDKQTAPTVEEAMAKERADGLESIEAYHAFARDVRSNMDELKAQLERIKAEGRTVYGLGAPLKGSTLLNYADIGPDLVEVLTEVNPYKIDLLSPGTHIPVVDESKLEKQPDYYLVLAWNFAPFLVQKYADYLETGGKFIVPVPRTRIVGAEAVAGGFKL
ncbi:class I SAM-dependent methyltransferase [Tepidamorphus sp. 3E244]|uniref:class I SAM-dependent methyltransferase n=1 Tax=Tepidamorphus sp. 3E244 TaxID=3385498 RepID=UPI0038FC381E